MAAKRQGRTGIFDGISRTPRRRSAPTGPQAALAALKGAAYSWDIASDSLTWGPNAAELLDLAPSALPQTGHAYARMVEPGSGQDRRDVIAVDGARHHAFDTRYALRFAPGRVLMVQDAGRWQVDGQGRPSLLRGFLRIDPAASAQELLPAAIRSRSALFGRIQDRIDEAAQLSHTCTLIVGAVAGEDIPSIEEVVHDLRPMMRRGDHAAALGPNHFVLLLACCPASEAASAMRRAFALVTANAEGLSVHLGGACSPDHTFEAMKLLRFAEQALDAAIARSESVVLHRMRAGGKARAGSEAPPDLVEALNDRRLTLACQPMADALSRQPALIQASPAVRSRTDGKACGLGIVPALETANLSLLVDGRLLELAADHLIRHPEMRLVLPVALATLADRDWLPTLAAHLGARPGIAPRLIVTVQEAALADVAAVLGPLNAMKALGLGIGLTGFGAGHASLPALRSVPVDLVVIDGVFIQSVKRSTDDRLFVRTLIDMAHRHGIAAAAEWVDDEASARLLAAWGIDYMQGALFGEVEPVAEPESILKRLRRA